MKIKADSAGDYIAIDDYDENCFAAKVETYREPGEVPEYPPQETEEERWAREIKERNDQKEKEEAVKKRNNIIAVAAVALFAICLIMPVGFYWSIMGSGLAAASIFAAIIAIIGSAWIAALLVDA